REYAFTVLAATSRSRARCVKKTVTSGGRSAAGCILSKATAAACSFLLHAPRCRGNDRLRQDHARPRAHGALRAPAGAGERGRGQPVAREVLRGTGGNASLRPAPPTPLPRHAFRRDAADARRRRKLGSRPYLVRRRGNLRARPFRAGVPERGRLDAVPAVVCRA